MVTKEEAKEKVRKLVEEFKEIPQERLDSKSEDQIRVEFIDPLFEALGWNMRKDANRNESILKGRADYILTLFNASVLVIEAKKTSVKLSEDEGKQAVGYAYHNNIKFCVVTNFKQIRIYHALSNPRDINKNLLVDKIGYLRINYEDFINQIDRLWLLSKESFENGEINKLLSLKDERINKPIDKSLLEDLLEIRKILSSDLNKLRGDQLSPEQIDEVVQLLIVRFIFMRSVEDRGLEEKDFLLNLVKDHETGRTTRRFWEILKIQFKIFNKEYDSKIFDESLLDLHGFFDEQSLIKVIKALYYGFHDSKGRYMFDAIPSDILGIIYEQYLGTILKGSEKRVKLDSKSGKRKKMGIYYTPAYIVEYIVKNTVGEYIKDKTINEILEVRILDPACGSGSFLIKAFQEVCNRIEFLLKEGKFSSKWDSFNTYKERLNVSQKSVIFKNCIYGVDLDERAIELSELNIALKILEGETRETKRRVLPALKDNIKCGNSLIDDYKISDHAFNWEVGFKTVMNLGGFDIIIGNPPYINAIQLTKTLGEKVKEYWKTKYNSAKGTYDIYILFFEQSLNICKEKGYVSFITPNKYLSSPYGIAFRELINNNYSILKVLDLSRVKVFEDPSVYPIIAIFRKVKPNRDYILYSEKIFSDNLDNKIVYKISSKNLTSLPDNIWGIILSDNLPIVEKVFNNSKKLEDVSEVQATSTAAEADEYSKNINEKNKGIPIINTGTIDRYSTTYGITKFMNKGKQLFRPYLDISKVSKNRLNLYKSPKIIIAKLALRVEGFPDFTGSYASINTNCIHTPKNLSLEFITALMNSKLISFVYSEIFSGLKMSGGYFQFQAPQLRILPVHLPTNSQEEKIKELVNKMLLLQQKYYYPKMIGHEKESLDRQIENIDYEIDEEIYKLYGITEQEKRVIEESLK